MVGGHALVVALVAWVVAWFRAARAHRIRFSAGLVLAGALAVVLSFVARPSPAGSFLACTPVWRVVPHVLTEVHGVAAESATDAWAAGSAQGGSSGTAAIEHWDGEKWSLSWQSGQVGSVFTAIAAYGSSAGWVVGYRSYAGHPGEPFSPLIESWDGTSWQVDKTPVLRGPAWLNGVVAVAADDVWAVGARWVPFRAGWMKRPPWLVRRPGVIRTLIEHWDGSSWRVVPSPNIGPATLVRTRFGKRVAASENQLLGIAAIAANDIWVVGKNAFPRRTSYGSKRYFDVYRVSTLVEHWDGMRWTVGPRPRRLGWSFPRSVPVLRSSELFLRWTGLGFTDVAAAPTGDLFAVAVLGTTGSVRRFSGSSWHPLPLHRPPPLQPYLPRTVTTVGDDNPWSMGYLSNVGSPSNLPLDAAARWDGSQWRLAQLPTKGTIQASAATSQNDVWVGGTLVPLTGSSSQPSMLHYTC